MSQQYERRDGEVVIFANAKKSGETSPDYTGMILIDGIDRRIALWKKTSKTKVDQQGRPLTFLKGQMDSVEQSMERSRGNGGGGPRPQPPVRSRGDDIPF